MSERLIEAQAALDQVRRERENRPPSLFDPPATYLESVEENAGERWNAHALEAVRRAAELNEFLTADEVVEFITEPVHDRRAVGPVLLRAAREGIIERVPDAYRVSRRPETHARPLALWRSCL